MDNKYLTISQLNKYIKYVIDNDSNLSEVFLKGEISNFKAHTRGHFYFTLKDETSRISAIMYASNTSKIKFTPADGMKVLVTGKISVFEANGAYQIYVSDMLEDGIGNLYVAFEQLKAKLAKEGLFDINKKKAIPKMPERIGVVTASTGAAIRDIVSTIQRRFPIAEIYLFPSLVQGPNAAVDIVKQIDRAKDYNLDTLIVGRGGGSIEDLWPFNEEIVARAIFACPIPTISAVGHEIDFTIADYVADLRAPTPTGAAEMAVPQKKDVLNYIEQLKIRLNKVLINNLTLNKEKLTRVKNSYIFTNPIALYESKGMIFDKIVERLKYGITSLYMLKEKDYLKVKNTNILQNPYQLLDKKANNYLNLLSKLETLNPLDTIKRGYTIVRSNGIVKTKSKEFKKGDILEIEFQDGKIKSSVL